MRSEELNSKLNELLEIIAKGPQDFPLTNKYDEVIQTHFLKIRTACFANPSTGNLMIMKIVGMFLNKGQKEESHIHNKALQHYMQFIGIFEEHNSSTDLDNEFIKLLSLAPSAGGIDFIRYLSFLSEEKKLAAKDIFKMNITPAMDFDQKVRFIHIFLESPNCTLENFKIATDLIALNKDEIKRILSAKIGNPKDYNIKSFANICLQNPTVSHLEIMEYINNDNELSTTIGLSLSLKNLFFDCQRAYVKGDALLIAHKMLDIIESNTEPKERDEIGLINFAAFFNYPELIRKELDRGCKLDVKGQRDSTLLTDLFMGNNRDEALNMLLDSPRFTAEEMGDIRRDLLGQLTSVEHINENLFNKSIRKFKDHFNESFKASAAFCLKRFFIELASPSISIDRVLQIYKNAGGVSLRNCMKLNATEQGFAEISFAKKTYIEMTPEDQSLEKANKLFALLFIQDPIILTADLKISRQYIQYDVYLFLEFLKDVDIKIATDSAGLSNQQFIKRIAENTQILVNFASAKQMEKKDFLPMIEKILSMAANLSQQQLIDKPAIEKLTNFHINILENKVPLKQTNNLYSWVNKSIGWDDPYTINKITQICPIEVFNRITDSMETMQKYNHEIEQQTKRVSIQLGV